MEFSRQEYWSGLPFPSPGDLPDPESEPESPALLADYLLSEPPGKPILCVCVCVCVCMDLDLSSMGLYVILCASWTSVTYLSHVRQILAIIPSNNFSSPFSLFFFDTCNMYVGSFNVVPEVSETVLISLHSFSFR